MVKAVPPYTVPSQKVRYIRRIFYELHRKCDEDIETWFDRIQNFVGSYCRFARNRQFMVIDKFVSELRINEIERIKQALTNKWTLQQLKKYFADECVQANVVYLNIGLDHGIANENQEMPVNAVECKEGNKPADDDNPLIELIPYISDSDDDHEQEIKEEVEDEEEVKVKIENTTPVSHERNYIESSSCVNISKMAGALETDVNADVDTIVDNIKCELDGYEYATTDQVKLEVCDIDEMIIENSHENQLQSWSASASNGGSGSCPQFDENSCIYHCDECDNTFTNAIGLKRHKEIDHHKLHELFACTVCDKRFTTTKDLREHILLTHKKKLACDQLQTHQYLRTGGYCRSHASSFECHLCGRSFPFNAHLKYHMKTHMGNWPS